MQTEREFVPHHQRPCNTLAWNSVNSNWLAAGLEKARSGVSLFIWDITSNSNVVALDKQRSSGLPGRNSSSGFSEAGPTYETTSIAWFPTESNNLIAGQGGKFLKIFDVRDQPEMYCKPKRFASTKAVNGVCVDPNFEYRVASFVEGDQGAVTVWDIRRFEKPLLILPSENVLQIQWNPTRSGLLTSLRRNENVLHLYDIQHGFPAYENTSYEAEPIVLERNTGALEHNISGFNWHPFDENRMLIVSTKGNISDLTILERICLSWSPQFSFSWGCGRHLMHCKGESAFSEDISRLMYVRACNLYGIEWSKSEANIQDPQLSKLWSWFHRVGNIVKSIDDRLSFVKYPGVASVIYGESSKQGLCPRSNKVENSKLLRTVYDSDLRQVALRLCNWNFDLDNGSSLKSFLHKLKSKGMFERAAAVAVFNSDISTAINILSEGSNSRMDVNRQPDSYLGMVAMALSGYTRDKTALWQNHCVQLCAKLSNPYLRALFTFLTCDTNNYEGILNDCKLEIEDQVAFACKFLSDDKLVSFLYELSRKMIDAGNLEGILVTGMTESGLSLLQNYINKTGDIQTACLLAINSLSPKYLNDSTKVDNWIQSYRDLLDRWGLWHERAKFDIYHSNKIGGFKVESQQISVSCSFCGNSILSKNPVSQAGRKLRFFSPKEKPTNKVKSMSCNGCGNPLPRCSQCLLRMGTTSTYHDNKTKSANESENDFTVDKRKLNVSDLWFAWCQTCRHGGHVKHMLEWFEEHTECPVNNCDCNCMSLDRVK
ncbi:LOW QUALITY PROTEIN: GATOR complex protein MIOS-like [Xenia sp. Carnegie-2017]|uniref:LOW QUALITY PROTEIN: GATOR complex protein MIOS-like n=1 Tax=Xenia sp. Carnegie-2017 TaxID=2897299 RepID=UPI001F03FEB7|nr:LOW QUALITY PROTEIN: GATOR complex protein MIOS-like [Xenia sp. Carnegie-2017]